MRLAKTLTPSSPILWNQAFAPKLCHWLFPSSSSSSHFDRFPIFPKSHNVHDLCCETRGRQLSNGPSSAMCTSVFCSAEIRRVLPCLLTFHKAIYFHTTGGHVITLLWSLWNHFNSRTRLNYSIRKGFRASVRLHTSKMISAKTKIFDETDGK